MLITNGFAEEFHWGTTVQTNITKEKVNQVIEKYVDENYPLKVQKYKEYLEKIKQTKIAKHSQNTFVEDNLMWQDNQDSSLKKLNRLEFKIYCRDLVLANRKDWRVPTYSELLTLVDYQKYNPATQEKIKYIQANKYWSGSKSFIQKENYWYVDFKDGTTNFAADMQKYNIRCVRVLSQKEGEY